MRRSILSKIERKTFPLIEGVIIEQKEGVLIRCILKERRKYSGLIPYSLLAIFLIFLLLIIFYNLSGVSIEVGGLFFLIFTLLGVSILIDKKRSSFIPTTKNFIPLAKEYLTSYFKNAEGK